MSNNTKPDYGFLKLFNYKAMGQFRSPFSMITNKILIVDDEPDLVELVSYNLKKEGFKVSTASDGEDALEKVRKSTFDLIILDLMLPGIQGVELCRMIRNNPKIEAIPIIMLTAKGEVSDKIRGLETGADDYMTKPFSPKELLPSESYPSPDWRRTSQDKPSHRYLRINTETYTVERRYSLHLSATEFKLLLFLAERKAEYSVANSSSTPYGRTNRSLSRGPLTCIYGG
jgi:DNA-binding response OmpR family regulator